MLFRSPTSSPAIVPMPKTSQLVMAIEDIGITLNVDTFSNSRIHASYFDSLLFSSQVNQKESLIFEILDALIILLAL